MPVAVQCPQCSKALNVPDAMLGQRGRCPACNHVFILSDSSIQAALSAPMPPPQAENFGHPQDNYGTVPRNDFENRPSGRPAIYTPPSTFHKLFYWYIALIAWFFLSALGFWITLSLSSPSGNPRPVRTSSNSLDEVVGGVGILFFVGSVLLLISILVAKVAVYYTVIYKAWGLIQDGGARTTPSQAVGFCFIPFFNFYWIFVGIRGLAEDLNQYAARRNMSIREASVGLVTASLIMWVVRIAAICVLSCIPGGNAVAFIAVLVLDILALNDIRNAAADIAEAKAVPLAENKFA